MMFELDIEHENSTDTLRILSPDDLGDDNAPSIQSLTTTRRLTKQPEWPDRAECVVFRDAWEEVEQNLDETNDRFVIREGGTIIFGGRLADAEINGTTVSVLINSPKRDAIDAERSGPNDLYGPQNDSTILTNELLPRIPTVDAGTIETVKSNIAFSESHASPGKSITKLARDADAEVRYRTTDTTFELDYVSRLGSDRTGEVISPGNATVVSDPRIREKVTENVSHIIVLGAGEGTAQVRAEAVADDFDPNTDRPVYRQRKDKDIQDASRAQSLAETLVNEYDGSPEYLEVDCEVPTSLQPELGDTFTVQLPKNGIDAVLRVVTRERLVDTSGDRYRLVLSNRRHTSDMSGEQSRVELESLSEGNAGQIIRDSDSQGFDKVDSNEPQEWFFDYPQNVFGEFEAVLRVESQPFRRPASAQGHSHAVDVTHPSHSHDVTHPSHSHQVTTTTGISGSPSSISFPNNSGGVATIPGTSSADIATYTPSDSTFLVCGVLNLRNASGSQRDIVVSLDDNTAGDIGLVDTNPMELGTDESVVVSGIAPGQREGNQLAWSVFNISGSDASIDFEATWTEMGVHTHDIGDTTQAALGSTESSTAALGTTTSETTDSETSLQPGIVTEDTLTPSNVRVEIGGTTVVSGLDHPIQETVDISGELSAGANTITTKSDTLGEVRTGITIEAIKNVGGDNQ